MPDGHPLSSLRFGNYDEPPASSSMSTPRTRRVQLQEALRETADIDSALSNISMSSFRNPSSFWNPGRRRQRSPESRNSTMRGTEPEDMTRRRSHKRRRLDSDAFSTHEPPIKYGYYGQVEPGRLRLRIVSCDGGTHQDKRHPQTPLGPSNVLKHDKSVYCSTRPNTSILFGHADDEPFCLEKLHIVGPEHGFTAPVRGGTAYVAMAMKDLHPYMDPPPYAQRHSVYNHTHRRRNLRSSPERLSFTEALRDIDVGDALRNLAEGRERGYGSRYTMHTTSQPTRLYSDDEDDVSGQSDSETNCEDPLSADQLDDPNQLNPDNVFVTLLSDDEPGPEEESSEDLLNFREERIREMRLRSDRLIRDRPWSNNPRSDDHDGRTSSRGLYHLDSMMARTYSFNPSPDEDHDDNTTFNGSRRHSNSDRVERNPRPTWSDPNVTRAKFYIQPGKHKVAIKFDPPVSGRFILVKMSTDRSNVDVQTIIAKGYGGLRFFPAMDFR